MSPWWSGGRGTLVVADVGGGFVVAEAPAMQRSIVDVLGTSARVHEPVGAELSFDEGADDRVVVVWHNRNVGFVPASHAMALLEQRRAAGRAPLVADGNAFWDGTLWRIWVGPPTSTPPPVDPWDDELQAPPLSIFGVRIDALDRRGDAGAGPRPPKS